MPYGQETPEDQPAPKSKPSGAQVTAKQPVG